MKKPVVLTLGVFSLQFLSGCVSSEKVETIDTEMEVKGGVQDETLGLNDDGEAILQKETAADDELLIQQRINLELEDDLEYEQTMLQSCSVDLTDPRLGGGEMPKFEEQETPRLVAETREEFGLTEDGDLKIVKRESFVKRLKQERRYQERLKDLISASARHRKKCEHRMKLARVKVGLPAERYKAEGYYDGDGRWVETRQAEMSIDDAFEIKRLGSDRAKAEARNDSVGEL